MKRAIEELRAKNEALAKRVASLEAEIAVKEAAPPSKGHTAVEPTVATDTEELTRRVKELEIARIAQEDATRAIIRDSVATLGSKINSAVSLGGALEVLAKRTHDFDGVKQSRLELNTAELDFEVQANDWTTAKMVVAYTDGTDVQFPSTSGFTTGVDRFTVDSASITVGDVQRFPLYVQAGKMTLGFGSTTGVHRADVLSINSPLTTEAFETKRNAIGLGFSLPTPALTRAAPPVIVPPVRPLALAPLVGALARQLGYQPPTIRPKPPMPVSLSPEPPPFYGGIYFYQGHNVGSERGFAHNINARLGLRAGGHCGRPYDELHSADLCPWSMDFNVDYIASVFDSQFFETEYRPFLDQIGAVRGMASTIKLSLGPVLVIGEWNGATRRVVFEDSTGTQHDIKPTAWQLSLGYQFDWNPWVETIGDQGTYVALGYSRSNDLAGAIHLVDAQPSRVGFLPRSRWTLTAGEWVMEGLKVALEYSRIKDYPVSQGGTGKTGNGLQMMMTYSW